MSPQTPQLNLFPARVVVAAEHEITEARVFVANGIARVFTKPNAPDIEIAGVVSVAGNPSRTKPTTITFDNGTTWEVFRAGGCGCGNSLKRFNARRWL